MDLNDTRSIVDFHVCVSSYYNGKTTDRSDLNYCIRTRMTIEFSAQIRFTFVNHMGETEENPFYLFDERRKNRSLLEILYEQIDGVTLENGV